MNNLRILNQHNRFSIFVFITLVLYVTTSCAGNTSDRYKGTVSSLIPPTLELPFTPIPTPTVSPGHLAIFEFIWETVDRDYLDPNFNGLDWNAIHQEYIQKIEAGMSDQAFYDAMTGMITRLGDNHSYFIHPDDMILLNGQFIQDPNYGSVGIDQMPDLENARTVISGVYLGSPADEAGLKPRDLLLSIDGAKPISDDGKIKTDLLHGPLGSMVTLIVQTPGQEPRQVVVTRKGFNDVMIVPYQVMISPEGKRIGYIILPYFDDIKVFDQVVQAINNIFLPSPLDGLILDDRMNAGGTVVVMSKILSLFVGGTVGNFISRSDTTPFDVGPLNDNNGSGKVPLVVLTGRGTASSAEILAGVLKDEQRAYLIGETTSGIVGLLKIYNIKDGSQLGVLHEAFRPINHPDEDWNRIGVSPDLKVEEPWIGVTIEKDPYIQAALNYLDQR